MIGLALALPVPVRSEQAQPENALEAGSGPPAAEMSRDAWRVQVETARRRVQAAARERRIHPDEDIGAHQDAERAATEHVLRDDRLAPGDVVATNKGLFVFMGAPDQPRRPQDFVPLPQR